MTCLLRKLSCVSLALAVVACAGRARADEPFTGRAVYLGGGVGAALGDSLEGMAAARLMATFPLPSRYLAMEASAFYGGLDAVGVDGADTTALEAAIGTGLRVAPPPDSLVRPYAAARIAHIHFFPDPWGEMDEDGSLTSRHRWAAGIGGGIEIPLGSGSRWRFALDVEALAVSNEGVDFLVHSVSSIGFAF